MRSRLIVKAKWRDQEAFVFIHGTHVKLTAAYFTGKYLYLQNGCRKLFE